MHLASRTEYSDRFLLAYQGAESSMDSSKAHAAALKLEESQQKNAEESRKRCVRACSVVQRSCAGFSVHAMRLFAGCRQCMGRRVCSTSVHNANVKHSIDFFNRRHAWLQHCLAAWPLCKHSACTCCRSLTRRRADKLHPVFSAQELAKVTVDKADVKLLAREFNLDVKAADAHLRAANGDLKTALHSLLNEGLPAAEAH